MEIEKKYLVKCLPDNLEQYDRWEIEQCYLCEHPVIRIRKKNESYILTYKGSLEEGKPSAWEPALCISNEVEVPLTEEAYCHLKGKADGLCLSKTRYRIPFGRHMVELDVFHGAYAGFCLAEVEFESIEAGRAFTPPDWFGRDVSGDYQYANSFLALRNGYETKDEE